MFIFQRERESSGGAERESGRESKAVSMLPVQSPIQDCLTNHEIMTWAKNQGLNAQQIEPPRCQVYHFQIIEKQR